MEDFGIEFPLCIVSKREDNTIRYPYENKEDFVKLILNTYITHDNREVVEFEFRGEYFNNTPSFQEIRLRYVDTGEIIEESTQYYREQLERVPEYI
jgi:hypothetical protein